MLGSVSAIQVFEAVRSRFTFADLGKELTIINSSIASNNRAVVITNIVSPTAVLTNPLLQPDAGSLRWELRELVASEVRETIVAVYAGDVESVAPGWILSDGYAELTVIKRQQFKSAADERKLLTLREGSDGSISSTLRFVSPTAAFTSRDVGRRLSIYGAQEYQNNNKFEIVDVLSSTQAVLDSTEIVAEPTGELVWALLRDPELTLYGSATLRGTVEQEGEDGEITAGGPPGVFKAESAYFTATDVGKLLTIHKPGYADNSTYEVLSITTDTTVTIDTAAAIALTTDLHWELRSTTDVGDETQVEVRAPSLLQYLAQDFGIEIDNREEEEWQRRWVASVSKWIGIKGHEDSYVYIAAMTGFIATVSGLYRVSQEIYIAATAAGGTTYAVGDASTDRFGTDGSLDLVAGRVRFTSPTAAFVAGDVGRHIEVSNSGSGNDGFRTIAIVVSSTVVEFRAADSMIGVADANNGSLVWRIVRLYSENAATIPAYDEINSDLMTQLKGAAVFTVDKYCWEPGWSTLLGAGDGLIVITGVDPAVSSAFPVIYTVTGRGDFDVAVGLGVGQWKLTDAATTEYYLETIPELLVSEQSGADGSLTLSGPSRFSAPSAVFAATDVGKRIEIKGSGSGNDDVYAIASYVSPTTVDLAALHVPNTPDVNNGSLTWYLFPFQFTVVATAPPAIGAATLQYICPEQLSCDFCRSHMMHISAITPYLLERGFERLRERFNLVLPAHVEIIEDYGVEVTASLSLTATLDSP